MSQHVSSPTSAPAHAARKFLRNCGTLRVPATRLQIPLPFVALALGSALAVTAWSAGWTPGSPLGLTSSNSADPPQASSSPLQWMRSTLDRVLGRSTKPRMAGLWSGTMNSADPKIAEALRLELEVQRDGIVRVVRWGDIPLDLAGGIGQWIITQVQADKATLVHSLTRVTDPDSQPENEKGELVLAGPDRLVFRPPYQENLHQFLAVHQLKWNDESDGDSLVITLDRAANPLAARATPPSTPAARRLVGIYRQHARADMTVQTKFEFAPDGTFEHRAEAAVPVAMPGGMALAQMLPHSATPQRKGIWTAVEADDEKLKVTMTFEDSGETQEVLAEFASEDHVTLHLPAGEYEMLPWERVPTVVD